MITINKHKSNEFGGCNACTKHFDQYGMKMHDVWIVELRGISIRLCKECLVKLKQNLQDAIDLEAKMIIREREKLERK